MDRKINAADDKVWRFSLQFNKNDPIQRYAYSAIAVQGRKKSAFISQAVKYYLENNPAASELIPVPQVDRSTIKAMLLDVLSELNGDQISETLSGQPTTIKSETSISESSPIVPQSLPVEQKQNSPIKEDQKIKDNSAEEIDSDEATAAIDQLLDGMAIFG